ncbi:MAG: hypothetical protein F6K41_13710 [Symploca sp. SIO3E6]|nr:hypothetical protein [Caldora sp. SIO3E6]
MSEKKGGERRSGGAEEEERTDNFWIQRSRNPTQNFVHPHSREQDAPTTLYSISSQFTSDE